MSADSQFMRALRFTAADLAANQRGELSPAQIEFQNAARTRLRETADQSERTSPLAVLMLGGMLVLIAVLLYFTGVLDQLRAQLGVYFLPALGVGAVLVLFLLLSAQRAQRESIATVRAMGSADQPLPRVQQVVGTVQTTRAAMRGGRPHYDEALEGGRVIMWFHYAMVTTPQGKQKISINEGGMEAFAPDQRYRLYFYEDEGGASLLSAEMVG